MDRFSDRAPRADARDSINDAYASVAHKLRDNGYSPVPLSDKAVRIKGWPAIFCDRRPSHDEIAQTWSSSRRGPIPLNGVGVANADGLTILDIDDDDAVERVLAIVPQAADAPACVGQRGRKMFLRAADGMNLRERNVSLAATGGAVEVLSWHRQGVVPPTIHPKTGAHYAWLNDEVTLLTLALHQLPTLTDEDIAAVRAKFTVPSEPSAAEKKLSAQRSREERVKGAEPASVGDPPPGWWETSTNRAAIDRLVRLFGIVHRAARDRGGRLVLQAEGCDAWGKPHRPEIIDINATGHWRHVVRIIVDVLGNTQEAYRLHIEVSRGNATLDLPGGPETYEEVGNKRFFDSVVDAATYQATKGKPPRTIKSLEWWARLVGGKAGQTPAEKSPRKKSLVKNFYATKARLLATGVTANVEVARRLAEARFRAGSEARAIVLEALDAVALFNGFASLPDHKQVAARHGVTPRAVQKALKDAELAGILVKTRGNEGGKVILLTVPVWTGSSEVPAFNGGVHRSPSLQSGGSGVWGQFGIDAPATHTHAEGEDDEGWAEWIDPPSPYGDVRPPTTGEEQEAFVRLKSEAVQGRCCEETLLETGILPGPATRYLLDIVEGNTAGKPAGKNTLRRIAGEIGELVLREPEKWPWCLQGALDQVADRIVKKKGRLTPCKWARTFAENLGYVHDRAGRATPMARQAQAARRRWEQKRDTAPPASGGDASSSEGEGA